MKKIIALVAALVLSVGGYFLYSFLMRKSTAELWTLIPDDAFAVIEVRESDDEWQEFKESKLRTFLDEFSYYKRIKEKVTYVSQSLQSGENYNLFDVLGDKTFLISFHNTDDLGIEGIMYLPITKEDKFFIKQIQKSFKSNPSFLIKTQKHESKKFNELHFLETNEILYFQEFHGIFIASFSKSLFFQTLKGKLDIKNFQKSRIAKLKKIHEENETETKNVNIFIDYPALSSALEYYVSENVSPVIKEIGNFANYSFLGLELDNNVATFSGFTSCSDSTINFLSIFDDQNPYKSDWLSMIPTNTITTNSFQISDPIAYSEKVQSYSWKGEENENPYTEFLELVSGEVLALNLLSSTGEMDKVFVYSTKDTDIALRWIEEQSTGQFETYNENKIGLLEKSDLASKLHGNLYKGTSVSVFSTFENYVILSSSLPAMKEYLLNIKSNNTWKATEREKENFEDHFLESNYSFFINPSLAKKAIYDDLTASGARLRDQGDESIAMSEFLLFEFSFQGEKYYTDVVVKFKEGNEILSTKEESEEIEKTADLKSLFEFQTESNLSSKAFVVKNYLHRTREVLVQDEANTLHMVDHEGKERWIYPLDAKIIGDVHEIDVFKNEKIQYLFATSKKIYILDRKGNIVENFPISLPDEKEIESLSLFDYDDNKNYRIVTCSGSDAYLFDVTGNNLEGWSPKSFSSEIKGSLNHLRVRGKDYVAAFLKDGRIDIVNRRGEGINGFPMNIGSKMACNGIISVGNNDAKTLFYSITEENKAVISNLNGKVITEIQLKGKTTLQLAQHSDDVVAISKDADHIFFQNLKTNTTLTIDGVYSNNVLYQFYNISGKRHYIITDLDNKKTIIYDSEASIVNKMDLPSSNEISLLYSSGKNIYRIYLIDGNRVRLVEF